MATLNQLVINLKPAPDMPKFSDKTPPEVAEWASEVRNWCRDAEKAIRILQSAHNQGV